MVRIYLQCVVIHCSVCCGFLTTDSIIQSFYLEEIRSYASDFYSCSLHPEQALSCFLSYLWNREVHGVLDMPRLVIEGRQHSICNSVLQERLDVLLKIQFLWRRAGFRLAVHGRGKHLVGGEERCTRRRQGEVTELVGKGEEKGYLQKKQSRKDTKARLL